MSGTANTITLSVGGKIYADWINARVSRAIDRMASEFEFTLVQRVNDAGTLPQIDIFSPCTVKIGNDLVLTGYVDAYQPSIAATQHVVQIRGRSKTEDIIDCTPDVAGGQFNGYKLDQIARAVAALFGIDVVISADVGDPFPDATIQRHETGFQFLERLARLRSVLLADDEMGRLVLTTAGAVNAKDALVQGRNLKSARAIINGAHRFSEYRVKTQVGVQPALPNLQLVPNTAGEAGRPASTSENDSSYQENAAAAADATDVPQSSSVTTTQGVIYDPGVPRFRPHVIVGESGLTSAQAIARAAWQAKHNAGQGTLISVETNGFRQSDGSLWKSNTIATVTAPLLQLDRPLLIARIEYEQNDRSGSVTKMTLGPVEAYQPDPAEVKIRKNKGKGGASAFDGQFTSNTANPNG